MRTGVLLGHPSWGGTYQYSLTVLEALGNSRRRDDVTVFATPPLDAAASDAAVYGWEVRPAEPPVTLPARVRGRLRRSLPLQRDERPPYAGGVPVDFELRRWYRRHGIELMLYPAPMHYAIEAGIPFVLMVHDLQHRLQPEFREVSGGGEAGRREHLYKNAVWKATLLVVESDVGKEDLLACYGDLGLGEERIRVLPYVAPPESATAIEPDAVARKYGLPGGYLFYPAQFWPHKNHLRLVEAVAALERRTGIIAPLVFCGDHGGDLREQAHQEVIALATDLGLSGRLFDLGYVPDEDLPGLYRGATALVMPTFFGPTNLPVLEAWRYGCPVLTSDLRGIREQVGDAGVLVDPRSASSIEEGIERLWLDEELRATLVSRGRQRLAAHSPDAFGEALERILEDAERLIR